MRNLLRRTGSLGRVAVTALTALALACEPREPAEGTPEAGEAGEGGTEDVRGMGSGGMGSMDDGMMERMRGHMEAMGSLPADSLGAMLPTHRQMVANMLAQMNREMREMEMPADSAWDATVDSLRSDLTRMLGMDPGELQAILPAHRDRLMRLMTMHREMMAGRGM